ncbi:hypothetical protein M2256_002001 [Lactococcus lactis]|uniref:Uncharacterized protein n=1 Tax=Lactococcus lactis TaxID=1358 RepID=A0AAW5TJZ9_9LACT|nr:hypothetical protein [Lactococcus lactis]
MEEQLKSINNKRAFLVSVIGEERLLEALKTLDDLVERNGITTITFEHLVSYYQILKRLPQ